MSLLFFLGASRLAGCVLALKGLHLSSTPSASLCSLNSSPRTSWAAGPAGRHSSCQPSHDSPAVHSSEPVHQPHMSPARHRSFNSSRLLADLAPEELRRRPTLAASNPLFSAHSCLLAAVLRTPCSLSRGACSSLRCRRSLFRRPPYQFPGRPPSRDHTFSMLNDHNDSALTTKDDLLAAVYAAEERLPSDLRSTIYVVCMDIPT